MTPDLRARIAAAEPERRPSRWPLWLAIVGAVCVVVGLILEGIV